MNIVNIFNNGGKVMVIATEFARQIILVIFYAIVIIAAVRIGVMMRKNKNAKENLKEE